MSVSHFHWLSWYICPLMMAVLRFYYRPRCRCQWCSWVLPILCLSSVPGPLILYGHVESIYYLDNVTVNPNTHGPIDAVRSSFGTALGYTPDNPHSGAAYYLTITMVVLVSLVAVIGNSVCQLTFTVLALTSLKELTWPIMVSKWVFIDSGLPLVYK